MFSKEKEGTIQLFQSYLWKTYKLFIYLFSSIFIIPFAYLIPKQNKIVLTTRFGNFDGNLKYLYLYLNQLDENIDVIFLTDKKEVYDYLRENGYTAWYYNRLSTLWRLFTVKVLVVDGNEWANNRLKPFFLFKAKKVQVWHGTGLKAISLLRSEVKPLKLLPKFFKAEYTLYDVVVFSSNYQKQVRQAAFRLKEPMINGLPRNDLFFHSHLSQHELIKDTELDRIHRYQEDGNFIVIYAPTWRKSDIALSKNDLAVLNHFAEKHRILFVIKFHSKQSGNSDLSVYPNLVEYDRNKDLYPLLSIVDLMITDYSSVYFDFLLVDKPILFYPYDKEEYIGKERELLLDYDEVITGPECKTMDEVLMEMERHLIQNEDPYKEKREELRKKFFNYQDGNSSERLWSYIKKWLA